MSPAAIPVTEIAITTRPTETPVWVDVSAYVEGFSIARGRQSEDDAAQAGTYSCVLRNDDRRFDPSHAGGPYFGDLKRMRRLRQRATAGGVTHDLYHGYIRSWTVYRERDGRQYVAVVADDGLRVLGLTDLNDSFPLERTDERIAAILAAANWQTGTPWLLGHATFGVLSTTTVLAPFGDQALDIGLSQVQAVTLEGTNALDHAQDVERSEQGLLFVSRLGGMTFHNRHRRLLAGQQAPLCVLGDLGDGTELPYVSVAIEYDDRLLYNDVRVTRTGGTEQTAADATSQDDHFVRTLRREILVPTDGEAAIVASYLLRLSKDPPPRIVSVGLDPHMEANPAGELWTRFLSAELGDVVTLRHRPWGGGNVLEQKSLVEGITVEWDTEAGVWSGTWALSPADTTGYWVLGDGVYSVLGSTTGLGV
jgi:hypothetical protein